MGNQDVQCQALRVARNRRSEIDNLDLVGGTRVDTVDELAISDAASHLVQVVVSRDLLGVLDQIDYLTLRILKGSSWRHRALATYRGVTVDVTVISADGPRRTVGRLILHWYFSLSKAKCMHSSPNSCWCNRCQSCWWYWPWWCTSWHLIDNDLVEVQGLDVSNLCIAVVIDSLDPVHHRLGSSPGWSRCLCR